MDQKSDKKEKVIHTRVSISLDEELRSRASGLGVSVSNLVRNVLLNTFGLVENVVADSANVARSVKRASGDDDAPGEPPGASPGEPPGASPGKPQGAVPGGSDVIGWQTLVLNLNAVCVTCNDILPKGTDAAVGVTHSGVRPISCLACIESLKKAAQAHATHTTAQSKQDESE